MRFAARITADPALSRTRNGNRTYHMRFAAGDRYFRQNLEHETDIRSTTCVSQPGRGRDRDKNEEQNEKQKEEQQGKGEQKAQKRPASDAGLHILYLVTY